VSPKVKEKEELVFLCLLTKVMDDFLLYLSLQSLQSL